MSAASSTFDYIIVGAEGQRRVCLSAHASRRGQGLDVATTTQAMIQAAVDRRAMLHPEQCCDQCLKWVKLGSGRVRTGCPFYPQEPTSSDRPGMSKTSGHHVFRISSHHSIGRMLKHVRVWATFGAKSFEACVMMHSLA